MNLGSLTTTCNSLAEESFSSAQVVEFVNDAIARINITCSANFPFMDTTSSEEYEGFPEKWQRSLFVPFVIGRMKQVDASQFEYSDNYGEFSNNLLVFNLKYPVPDEYKDSNEPESYAHDFTPNYWGWK
jgi:hypothetical protein